MLYTVLTILIIFSHKISALDDFSYKDLSSGGRLIIKFREEKKGVHYKLFCKHYGLYEIINYQQTGFKVYNISSGYTAEQIISVLKENDMVEKVEADHLYRCNVIPDDPLFKQQWGLNNTGELENSKSDADIDAPEAWNISTGNYVIIIAVIDTGLNYNHSDIKENIWINEDEIPDNNKDDDGNGYVDDAMGWNFVENTPEVMDDMKYVNHGTHVSGIIGAEGDNKIGIAGVNWNIKIMVLKSFNKYGWGYTSSIVSAIDYAINKDAHIINASWGSYYPSELLKKQIEKAMNKGIIFVAAAGNANLNTDGEIKSYPACFELPNIVSVGASTPEDKKAYFSNYGEKSVKLFAPGYSILSLADNGGYRYLSGTSMAAPFVSGAAGLLWGMNSSTRFSDVIDVLLSTTEKPSELYGLSENGRLNLCSAALEYKKRYGMLARGLKLDERLRYFLYLWLTGKINL